MPREVQELLDMRWCDMQRGILRSAQDDNFV